MLEQIFMFSDSSPGYSLGAHEEAIRTPEPFSFEERLPRLTDDKLSVSQVGDAGEMLDTRAKRVA
jgi:hypothetical protein